jgi:hypothetical protein
MKKVKKFICTTDKETRDKLIAEGLIEIKNANGVYTFLSNGKINFELDNSKIKLTNSLCI